MENHYNYRNIFSKHYMTVTSEGNDLYGQPENVSMESHLVNKIKCRT